jgi:hypothetical protein
LIAKAANSTTRSDVGESNVAQLQRDLWIESQKKRPRIKPLAA